MQIPLASVDWCVLVSATVIILNEGTVNKPKLPKVTLNFSQNLDLGCLHYMLTIIGLKIILI